MVMVVARATSARLKTGIFRRIVRLKLCANFNFFRGELCHISFSNGG